MIRHYWVKVWRREKHRNVNLYFGITFILQMAEWDSFFFHCGNREFQLSPPSAHLFIWLFLYFIEIGFRIASPLTTTISISLKKCQDFLAFCSLIPTAHQSQTQNIQSNSIYVFLSYLSVFFSAYFSSSLSPSLSFPPSFPPFVLFLQCG